MDDHDDEFPVRATGSFEISDAAWAELVRRADTPHETNPKLTAMLASARLRRVR